MFMERYYYVYMLASDRYGTLYIGVTRDLVKRVWEHRDDVVDGFTKIKKWNRDWKVNLIQKMNPGWDDLYESIV